MIGHIVQSPLFLMLVMTAISGIYFYLDRSSRIMQRIFNSTHGVAGAALLFGAILIWNNDLSESKLLTPFSWLFLIPLASIIFSFIFFSGNKFVHILQIPNLVGLAWCWFVGAMAITGDWL